MQDFTLDKGKIAIATAGLFCLLAVYAAVTEFRLPSDAQAVEPAQAIVELEPVDIQQLSQTHLFGQPPQSVVKVDNDALMNQRRLDEENRRKLQQQQEQAKARPIDINVTVTGLLASNDADFSAAVLKVDNKPEKLYRVGEDLGKPEVRLESVDRDSIVIDNNGNAQIIAIKRPELVSGAALNRGSQNNQQNFNQGNNQIPELPPELQMPEETGNINSDAEGGAYTPPLPEPVEFEPQQPAFDDDIQEQMIQDQLQAEMGQQMIPEDEMEVDDHGDYEEELLPPELRTDPSSADFQMPVF